MRCTFHALSLLPLLLPSAFAQNSTTNSTSYIAGLIGALSSLNLTQLVSVAEEIANTAAGAALLNALPNGNKTIFAPNDAAFAAIPSNITQNVDELGLILEYHFISGAFPPAAFAMAPNHTVMRTFLNDSSIVQLESNRSQVLVAENMAGNITILNQATNVTVVSTAMYQNLIVHVIDAVLMPPPTIADLAQADGLDMLLAAAALANLTDPLVDSHGITLFAPNDAAFSAAEQMLGAAAANGTLIGAVLGNHIINGTSLYSPELLAGNMNFTTASGEMLSTIANSSGLFVMSGNVTAKVLMSDLLIENGVVHVIDTVLANTESNPSAAASAYSSLTSVQATQTAMETGAVGGSASQSAASASSASASGSSSSGAAGKVGLSGALWTVALGVSGLGLLFGSLLVF